MDFYESETLKFIKRTPINRNKDWKELDLVYIEEKVGEISLYEFKMIMNTCKDEEMAIRAINNKRMSDNAYDNIIFESEITRKREKYFSKKYNDMEEDNERRNFR